MSFWRAAIILFLAPLLHAQATYSTGFEPPTFVSGDVNGQNGWGHLSNSPTAGAIEPVPAGSPPMFGTQSLAIRSRSPIYAGVTNHLFSPRIDPAGESGSIIGSVPVADPKSHFSASLWFHTPPAPVISTRPDGRFAELNPSSKGPAATDGAQRYAQVRLFNSTNTVAGQVRVEIGWYQAAGFTIATVAQLNWNEWYRFDYLIELVDGTSGPEPNDRFTLTVFDAAGTQLGTACGSTWELGWKSGTFDGSTAARAINGFDFASLSFPEGNLAGHLDELTMSTFDASAPFAVSIAGSASIPMGGLATLSANVTGANGSITGYVWRDALSNVVGTSATLDAPAGTYTVTVTDQLCGNATSPAFVVSTASVAAVPTATEWGLALLLAALLVAALHRLT